MGQSLVDSDASMSSAGSTPAREVRVSPGLEWWIERFEEAWAMGIPPALADFLPAAGAGPRQAVLTELVMVDLEHRWRRAGKGEPRQVPPQPLYLEDYCRQLPEFGPLEEVPLECLVQEYRVRRRWGVPPLTEEYARRFPARMVALLPELVRLERELPGRVCDRPPLAAAPTPPCGAAPTTNGAAFLPRVPGYEIVREIGHGGMGVVYEARQLALSRTVALKMICGSSLLDPKALLRFEQEAAAVARLQHPNIVQIHEIARHEGVPYCCLEYVSGGSLARRLTGTPLAPGDAAGLVEELAAGLEAVHRCGIVHRDLKPGNILLAPRAVVEKGGSRTSLSTSAETLPLRVADFIPKIADFGLARPLEDRGLTETGDILGTPSYMAPEQAEGDGARLGPEADVYALGTILYELLTGRRPFQAATVVETLQQVRSQEPVAPTRFVAKLPRDLETICLKCLEKLPARRYASAQELADDLARFRRREPIRARRMSRMERVRRWCRRNPGIALALAGIMLLLVSLGAILYLRVREQEYELIVQQARALLTAPRRAGWRETIGEQLAAAARIRREARLRDLAVARLAGLDARPGPSLRGERVSRVAFDRTGRRLLLGGTNDDLARPRSSAILWDLETGDRNSAIHKGAGPVAFRRTDGIPLQLIPRPGGVVLLWDVSQQRPVCEGRFALPAGTACKWVIDDVDREVMALSEDGALFAAAVSSDDSVWVGVWEGKSGKLLRQVAVRATAMAFTRSETAAATRLAIGDLKGQITMLPVFGTDEAAPFSADRTAIQGLAFGGEDLLAAGDASGSITIWRQRNRDWRPVTHLRGAPYAIYELAFSADKTALASGGRHYVHLWDVGTGQRLLEMSVGDYITGLAFAPGGSGFRLAATAHDRTERSRGVWSWDLEADQGLAMLRGLNTQIASVRFSADGRFVAALAHDWRIGVWKLSDTDAGDTGARNVPAARLWRIFEAPPGHHVDNATAIFRDDGRQLAFAGCAQARLWDLNTGQELGSWSLPIGLCDSLAFDHAGQLRSFRVETHDGKLPPYTSAPFKEHPRVCRLRQLEPHRAPKLLGTFTQCNRGAEQSTALPGGEWFLVNSVRDDGVNPARYSLTAVGADKVGWQIALAPPMGYVVVDPAGKITAAVTGGDQPIKVIDVTSGGVLGHLPREGVLALGPGASHFLAPGPQEPGTGIRRGLRLFRRGQADALVTFGAQNIPTGSPSFDRTGTRIAWGNADGSVCLCNLPLIREHLGRMALNWED